MEKYYQYHLKKSINRVFHLLIGLIISLIFLACKGNSINSDGEEDFQHIRVFYEKGKYGGWAANWGMWSWDEEILVGFTYSDHKGVSGHTFDRAKSLAKFARSLDGGNSWSIEDAFEAGITKSTFDHHNLGDKSQSAKKLMNSIDFTHPDLAINFRLSHMLDGPSSFYYSYNRGRKWEGPFKLSVDFIGPEPTGITTRTDYIIDGQHELTAFLTVGFREGEHHWREVAAVRTTDGGKTWKHLSWIGPRGINSIMPSSIRLDSSRILTPIRLTDRTNPEMVSYISVDNGYTWNKLNNPVQVDANGHPPALLKLQDGRLCLVYGIRSEETMSDGIGMYASFSRDEGVSWSDPVLIRGKDGANGDIGYPRAVQLPDGNVVAVYYYNNANDENSPPYRYIAATIFNPDQY